MRTAAERLTGSSAAYAAYIASIADRLVRLDPAEWPDRLPETSTPEERARLIGVAMAAHKASPRNWDGAKDTFLREIRGDAALLWELFAPYRQEAVQLVLAEAAKRLREQQPVLASAGERQRATPAAGASAVAGTHLAALLDTFRINGKPLGDVTARRASAWATRRERDARFIRLLVQNLPPDDPIRKWRTADQAREMYLEAGNE